uniref:Uncharacterized protein n=1 Tax=Solanum lycopersicum TaxID=4081 RepID=A0A3Q7GR17_SOLLC
MFFGYSRNGTKGKTYILCIKQTPTIQKYPSDRSMKYGVSTKMTHFHEQDYVWIRRGMLFAFIEHIDRLQGQTYLNNNMHVDLRSATEEAFLA